MIIGVFWVQVPFVLAPGTAVWPRTIIGNVPAAATKMQAAASWTAFMTVVAAEGKVHAIGGRFTNSGDRTDMHDIYDLVTDTWTSGPPLPTARSGLAYAYSKDKIRQTGAGNRPRKGRHLSSMAQLQQATGII